jgi:hypothetical protein
LAAESAGQYEAIYQRMGRSFSCINAATMWLLAGDRARALRLATAARTLARSASVSTDEDAYWLAATEAEAELILGNEDAAAGALRRARNLATEQASLATTRHQLEVVCAAGGLVTDALAALATHTVSHFCGRRVEPAGRLPAGGEAGVATAAAQHLAALDVGVAYGSLACGGDIILAEQILERHAELHVVLPFPVDEFISASVEPGGEGWVERFARCLDAATSVTVTAPSGTSQQAALFGLCSVVAMGRAVMRAKGLGTEPVQLAVVADDADEGVAGTASDVRRWQRAGHRTVRLWPDAPKGRRSRHAANLVDSSLQLMAFIDTPSLDNGAPGDVADYLQTTAPAVAAAISSIPEAVVLRTTWRSGACIVLRSANEAAAIGLTLQRAIDELAAQASRTTQLLPRVLFHGAPAVSLIDPISALPVVHTPDRTRVERVASSAPAGSVYCTDVFAALLALEPACPAQAHFVGQLADREAGGGAAVYVLAAASRLDDPTQRMDHATPGVAGAPPPLTTISPPAGGVVTPPATSRAV